MYDSILFVLQASQSSQAPSMQWGGSPAAVTASGRILAAFEFKLLAFAPIAVSRSAWRPSSPIDGSGLLATTAAVGISTWRVGTAALWIASIEDIAASSDDFHAIHSMFT